ncbi:MAG TPA: hypothetical protein VM452_13650 [Caulifigura sp.]|nr:hypothetical protein [Caulifigura sp.]
MRTTRRTRDLRITTASALLSGLAETEMATGTTIPATKEAGGISTMAMDTVMVTIIMTTTTGRPSHPLILATVMDTAIMGMATDITMVIVEEI